ncbi:protein SPT2 homolog [Scaptodrosophila lebanonensis]|uniref:Protein SPT2 homolog n=1 Tax=Drosophila lebanonensis TaxID=7225 RepID=A0A6J2TJ20_DROLE|nr:protein SPT2 homolog [Scaptodrosophila lebanonensis]
MSRLMTAKEKREIADRKRRERKRMQEVARKEREGFYKQFKQRRHCASVKERIGSKSSNRLFDEVEDEDDDDDDDEEDMSDFIVEGQERELENVSLHIRDIFGYDKRRYRDDSDDDLSNMESTFAQVQREEQMSQRLGRKEDIADMRLERELKKRKLKQ